MKTWINPKSIYETIEDAVPSGKYDAEIQRVLLEEKEGGKYEFLKGRYSLFELDISRRQRIKDSLQEDFNALKHQMKSIQSLSSKEVDSLYMKRYALEDSIRYNETLLSNLVKVDKIWNEYLVSYRVVVNKFRQTKDIQYLRKGAHVLGEYRDFLLQDTELIVRKQLLIEVLKESPEFEKQLNLSRQSMPALCKLLELLKESKKRKDAKFLTEAIVYTKTQYPELFENDEPIEIVQTEPQQVEWDSPAPLDETQKKTLYEEGIEEKASEEAEEEDYLYRSVKWSSGK